MTTSKVYLLDANVLIALSDPRHSHHMAAQRWFDSLKNFKFATCSITESAFIRLMVNPAVGDETPATAFALLDQMRALPTFMFIEDDASLAEPVIDRSYLFGYKQVTDFQLVNLAAKHKAVFATFDSRLNASLAEADRHYVFIIPV